MLGCAPCTTSELLREISQVQRAKAKARKAKEKEKASVQARARALVDMQALGTIVFVRPSSFSVLCSKARVWQGISLNRVVTSFPGTLVSTTKQMYAWKRILK